MRAVKRWRYYCDHCKKSGMSRFHMGNHEKSCTMNPARECKLCVWLSGGSPTTLPELLAVLPDPAQFVIKHPPENLGFGLGDIPGYDSTDDDAMRLAAHAVLPKLREMTENCPVCILAALRQKGIPVPVVTDFNFTSEMKLAQAAMNNVRRENDPY